MNRKQRRATRATNTVDALLHQGQLAHAKGDLFEAESCYRQALEQDKRNPKIFSLLSVIAYQMGEHRDSLALVARSIVLDPSVATSYGGRADACASLFDADQSIKNYTRALQISPGFLEAIVNLGMVFLSKNRLREAILWLRQAVVLSPGFEEALNNLGNAYQYNGEFVHAANVYRRVIAINPTSITGHHNLGTALSDIGDIDGSMTAITEAIKIKPEHADTIGAALLFGMLYQSSTTAESFYIAAQTWAKGFLKAHPIKAPPNYGVRSHTVPKLGFISGDLRQHAVGMLVIGALEGLQRQGFEIYLYANSPFWDKMSERISKTGHWRNIYSATDEETARQIYEDGVDILIDLAGFTGHNRIEVMTYRAAPIQIFGWLGYPGTSTLPCMDYVISDWYQLPAEHEPFYSEKIIRLPNSYTCFVPPDDAPDITPRKPDQPVTFGSFNVLKKISPECVAVWSKVLKSLPESEMLIKAKGLDCQLTQKRYLDMFGSHGIAPGRIKFRGASSQIEHMRAMLDVDVVLDTMPYSGGQTTLECLWMGRPVVTLVGDTWASRHSLSYLESLRLGALASFLEEFYVTSAIASAMGEHDISQWRKKMLASPLCDVDLFSAHLGVELTKIWGKR